MQTEKLIIFLRKLVADIEQNKLDKNKLANVSQFYMRWQFAEDEGEYSYNELLKYLSLGWYMYTYLLTNKSN